MNVEKVLKSSRDEIWVKVGKNELEKALHELKAAGVERISSITGTDIGNAIDVTYHFFHNGKSINLRVPLPKQNPRIQTITPIYPGAELFERELSEMLGIKILGHPDPRRLFLPEDWKGKPPYRK